MLNLILIQLRYKTIVLFLFLLYNFVRIAMVISNMKFLKKKWNVLNRKGFTLIELLAVIVVTSLVLGLSAYGIINSYQKSTKKIFALNEKSILEAARIYSAEASSSEWRTLEDDTENEYFCTSVQRLKNVGLLKKEATSSVFNDVSLIGVKRNNLTSNVDDVLILHEDGDNSDVYDLCMRNIQFYTLHYDALSGSPTPYDVVSEVGLPVSISKTIPQKTGYTFKYWVDEDENHYSSKGGKGLLNEFLGEEESYYTLNAEYSSNAYGISFDANGGSGTTPDVKCTYDSECQLSKNSFTRTGHEFMGWATSKSGSVVYGDEEVVFNLTATDGEIINLYAKWEPIIYKVHYDGNTATGESYTDNTSCTNGKCGMDRYAEGSTFEDGIFKSNRDWKYNTSYNLIANRFTKTGYTFQGWAVTSDGPKAYNDKASVINLLSVVGIKMLYAKWTANTYYVSFNANGGTGTITTINCTYDSECTLPSSGFTRTGYKLLGWSTQVNGEVDYDLGQKVTNLTSTKGAIVPLYAVWDKAKYYVWYDGNGATSETYDDTGQCNSDNQCGLGRYAEGSIYENGVFKHNAAHKYDSSFNLIMNRFIRSEYTFAGWNTKADGTGTSYLDKESVKNLTAVDGTTITLYAQWAPNKLNVRFKPGNSNVTVSAETTLNDVTYNWRILNDFIERKKEGETSYTKDFFSIKAGTTKDLVDYNSNQYLQLSLTGYHVPTNTVWKCTGCKNPYYNQTTEYAPSQICSIENGDCTVTMEPNWAANTYTIQFDKNGGTGSMATLSCKYDQDCTLSSNNFTYSSKNFVGWSLKANPTSSDVIYGNNAVVLNLTSTNYGTVKLYAQWTNNDVSVAYSCNGGSGNISPTICTTNTACTLANNTCTRTGYNLSGNEWYSSSTGATPKYTGGSSVTNITNSGSITLYAKWVPQTYTITLNANGASVSQSSVTCTYNTPCTLPTITRAGYTINGWNTNADGTGTTVSSTAYYATGNTTLYAQTTKTVTVTFDANGSGLQMEGATGTTTTATCTMKNTDSTCTVHTPAISGSSTSAHGFFYSTSQNETSSYENATGRRWYANANGGISENKTYYIAYKRLTAVYYRNGATKIDNKTSDSITKTCVASLGYGNLPTTCSVTSPTITRSDYEIVGWGTSASATSGSTAGASMTLSASTANYYAITRITISVKFDPNGSGLSIEGASSAGTSVTKTCYIYNSNTSCSIKTPKIAGNETKNNSYYYSTSSSTTGLYNSSLSTHWYAGDDRSFSSSRTLYVIYRKLTVKFEPNGAKLNSGSSPVTRSCVVSQGKYSGANNAVTSCSITTPTITRDNYSAVGFNTSSSATESQWASAGSETISSDGATYYAITRKKVSVTFDPNGSGLQIEGASSAGAAYTKTCYMYNADTSCSIKTPKIAGNETKNNSYYYSTSSSTTGLYNSSLSTHWYAGEYRNFSTTRTMYVIYKKLTVKFEPNGAKLNSGSSSITRSCIVSQGKYSGANDAVTSCSILSPSITRSGYDIIGFNTSSSGTTSQWNSNTTKSVSSSSTYYAITKSSSSGTNNYKVYLNRNRSSVNWQNSASCKWLDGGSDGRSVSYTGSKYISYFPVIYIKPFETYSLGGWRVGSSTSSTIIRSYVDSAENGKTLYAYWVNNPSSGSCTCSSVSDCSKYSSSYYTLKCENSMCVMYDNSNNPLGSMCW